MPLRKIPPSLALLAKLMVVASLSLSSCTSLESPFTELEADGFRHDASGFVFPARLGQFKRGESTRYDRDGKDVSWQYTRYHLRDRLNATVYVYPFHGRLGAAASASADSGRALLEVEFERVKEDLLAQQPEAKRVFQDHSILRLQGQERYALMANFIFMDKVGIFDIQFFTTAYLIEMGDWLALIRLTAPDDSVGRSTEAIGGFLDALLGANDGKRLPKGYGD